MELAPIAEAPPSFARYACKDTTFFSNSTLYFRILTLFAHKKCSFFHESRYIMYGNSPEQLNSNYNDEQKSFVLAVGGDAADGV